MLTCRDGTLEELFCPIMHRLSLALVNTRISFRKRDEGSDSGIV